LQSHYPFVFEREMGCTADELRTWLPGAAGDRAVSWRDGGADIALDGGRIAIDWRALEPRRIALLAMPRLHVRFEAHGIGEAAWQRFMRYFDLYTQRGGG
jgi:hypothetical protein